MGPLKREEKFMAIIFMVILVLWITGTLTHIDATLTALVGLSLLFNF